jgi:glycosyltransferase involved in cell wall biosynthesis
MPFAMNEATRFINPTKALEYMATGRPIISTPVEDVVTQFRSVITIADTASGFAEACEREADQPEALRIERGLELASRNSWESIVAHLEQHIAEALCSRCALTENAA